MNLNKFWSKKCDKWDGFALLAMRMSSNFLTKSEGLGSGQQRKRNELVLTRTRQMRKAVLNSVG
jgi:hypothetical protein